jgi:hypothetical protein
LAEFAFVSLSLTREYSYVLLAAAILCALVRLGRTFRLAERQSLNLQRPEVRRVQIILGTFAWGGAIALIVFWALHIGEPWFWLLALVTALSGTQSLLTVAFHSPLQLLNMDRLFGVLFAGVAVLIYFMFVR